MERSKIRRIASASLEHDAVEMMDPNLAHNHSWENNPNSLTPQQCVVVYASWLNREDTLYENRENHVSVNPAINCLSPEDKQQMDKLATHSKVLREYLRTHGESNYANSCKARLNEVIAEQQRIEGAQSLSTTAAFIWTMVNAKPELATDAVIAKAKKFLSSRIASKTPKAKCEIFAKATAILIQRHKSESPIKSRNELARLVGCSPNARELKRAIEQISYS